ncbi:hypothetical protein [Microbacterium nymphoidis]|uniref:hypothetical protein n=2 Tax=Microbacterium TaxID=33882 RepID=UPI001E536819|nr:hypothetical protein [Microbacterium nymphoidis]MCD2497598.1 hypothetical protein [Microbacterium nymphoidis]
MGEQITVTEADIRGIRRDFTRYVVTRPATIVALVVFAMATIVFVIVALAAQPFFWVAAAVAAFVLVLLPSALGRQVTRAARAAMPAGSWMRAWIEDGALKTAGPTGSASTSLPAFRRAMVHPDAVLVQRTGSNVVGVFPRRCFTLEEIEVLRRVDAARGRGVQSSPPAPAA